MFKKIAVFLLTMMFMNPVLANANTLDERWTSAREISNRLGDLALKGDRDAFADLKRLSVILHDPTAAHNIGWLYETGFPDHPSDKEKACIMYRKGSISDYPPSMHAYALCQFAASGGPGADDEFEAKGINLMFGAVKAGWTNSGIFLGNYILILPTLTQNDATGAKIAIEYGLKSNPTHDQKVTLSYLKGMAVIYGKDGPSTYYENGRDAPMFAAENAHPHTENALPKLYTRWVHALTISMAAWSEPEQLGMDCYRNRQLTLNDPRTHSLECGDLNSQDERALKRLQDASDRLRYYETISPQEEETLDLAIQSLKVRSARFRADDKELVNIFIQSLSDE